MSSRSAARLEIIARAALARVRGSRRPAAAPRRILIAHQLLLGDVLMLTPLLAKLRTRFPDAEIVMTAALPYAPLYSRAPYGVSIVACEMRRRESLAPLWRGGGYDLALVPGDNRYSWLALAAGARWIVAFDGDRPAYKSWPADELRPFPAVATVWGDACGGLVDGPEPPPYATSQWPAPAAAPFEAPPQPYAVLHVGSGNRLRGWMPQRWMDLAAALQVRGVIPVWSGGRGEQSIVDTIDAGGKYRSYAGRLDLAQLWQLLAHARLLVCPDTGVSHLGRIVGVPTVALFGPGSVELFGAGRFWSDAPYDALHVADFPCRDQRTLFKREIAWVRRCARSQRECLQARCMEALDYPAVESAVLRRLTFNPQPPAAIIRIS